jgi:dsRNA-specific ribonuclease
MASIRSSKIESFKDQDNKTCEYAKLLQFLESSAGRQNCFQLIEVISEGEKTELRGRVNDYDLTVHNGKKHTFPGGFTNRVEVGMGKDNFSLDAAKEIFVTQVFKLYGFDTVDNSTRVGCQQELQGWPALTQLEKFLPQCQVDVLDMASSKSTVVVSLNNKTLAKTGAQSVHAAKHAAACQALNNSQYKEIYARSVSSRSCGFVRAEIACPEQPNYENMTKLLKRNLLTSKGKTVYGFDESAGVVYAQLEVEKKGGSVDVAAKRVYNVLTDLRLNGKTKKKLAAERRLETDQIQKAKRAKFFEQHANVVLAGICSKLKLELNYEFNDEKNFDELHKCTVTIDDISITGKDTTKKLAKASAAEKVIPILVKKNPGWFSSTLGRPEPEGMATE